MAEPSRFNQMRLPDISCREDESDLRGRYQPLAIGSSQLGRRKPQSLRLIAGSNHAGLVDVCPLDLLFFVGILQMGHSNAPANGGVPSRGISAPKLAMQRQRPRPRPTAQEDTY